MLGEPDATMVDTCWTRIGVRGDRSCDRLPVVTHCQNCEVFSRAARTLLDRPASDEYLAEVTGFVAEPAEARRIATQSALMFGLAAERYAVWARDVLEVAEVAPPRRIPHRTKQAFLGVINIQGRLELCISLAALLGVPPPPPLADGRLRVLVVAHETHRWVFSIGDVRGMLRVDGAALLDVPASSARRDTLFLSGLLKNHNEAFGVLDVGRICRASAQQVT